MNLPNAAFPSEKPGTNPGLVSGIPNMIALVLSRRNKRINSESPPTSTVKPVRGGLRFVNGRLKCGSGISSPGVMARVWGPVFATFISIVMPVMHTASPKTSRIFFRPPALPGSGAGQGRWPEKDAGSFRRCRVHHRHDNADECRKYRTPYPRHYPRRGDSGPHTRAITPGEEIPDPHFNRPLTKRNPPLTGLTVEVGGDSELIRLLRRDNTKAIMFGIPDTNPGLVPGFSLGKAAFGKFMSPIPGTSPELYWQDDVLRSSETSGTVRVVHAYDGADAMKTAIGKADRSRIHVIHVELAGVQDYLQPAFIKGSEFPPLKYAYNHPDDPRLQQDALLPAAGVDAAYAREDALLQWLVEDFFPTDPGSRMVSSTDLMQMAVPSTGFSISVAGLRAALADFLKATGNNTVLPPVFRADGHYLSLANIFQLMTDALADFSRTGKLPESVKVVQVYGPVRLLLGHGPNAGEVSVRSIARVCAQIDAGLHDGSPGKFPKNAIPVSLTVEGVAMNPAQFLRLMALALAASSPDAKLPVRMLYRSEE